MSVTFTVQVGTTLLQVGTTTPTTNPMGVEITLNGPNATSNLPGSQTDPADFWGIFLVLIGIALAIFLARWIFGRNGPAPR